MTMNTTRSYFSTSGVRTSGPYWLVTFSIISMLHGCGNRDMTKATAQDACIENGIAYYKEIGSYPTLTSAGMEGRRAEDVAAEKCARSIQAFPSKR